MYFDGTITAQAGKICSKCMVYKPYTEYHKNQSSSDGHYSSCKECNKENSRTWNNSNKDKCKNRSTLMASKYAGITSKICTKCGELKSFSEFSKSSFHTIGHKSACKGCLSAQEFERANKSKPFVTHKICSTCGMDKPITDFVKDKYKKDGYHQECRECKSIYRKEYRQNNRTRLTEQRTQKLHVDIQLKLSHSLRTRINKYVSKSSKPGSAVRDLGCSIVFLKEYLEHKFYNHPITG